ncbi:uncharacterized protein LOC110268431 [Arachis ipaensis]|uniref:uncharacterized protein LOC110268431 n=1 Tax=Arachis ipaensis TaxID=130454 RepID=UPI000A2B3609|nr:uncharacterized protein LOC110268431 [Arachis ipaensis]
MGFGQRWRGWVMECVSTSSMSVLINGSPSKPFKMERGLRQGDPLSPFLFVLVVDVLHRMIGKAVRNGRISPLLVRRDHIELSHLQFADDTVLFCPPEEETIKNYRRLLRCFQLIVLGCKQANLPVKYLGISLGANPRMVKTWKPVIDKVEEKLSLWKAKILNKAGVAGGNGPGGYIKLQFHKDYLERPGPSQSRVVYLVCPDWQSQYEGETESAWGHSPRR